MSGTAVGIGIFDGVHLGHQALLKKTLEIAEAQGLTSTALTFDPHPAALLNPSLAPPMIETVARRCERIRALGITTVVVEPFTLAFAETPPERFAKELLRERLTARAVVVGENFTFGHKQAGHVALLAQLGWALGFSVHPVPLLRVSGITVSSTKVREFVHAGQMDGAATLLGRPFALEGLVVRGHGRGKGLGIPTANVASTSALLPATGVYAARTTGAFGTLPSVVNVGVAPTFGGTHLCVESHVLDYAGGDFYGTPLRVELVARLRDETRFDSLEALKQQIHRDIAQARLCV